jgi:two-component system, cell cycle sensor histidine kinase and response regulator CckA
MTLHAKIVFLVAAVALTMCRAPAGAQQTGSEDGRRHVLILNSYHKEFPWTDNQVAGAREVLNEALKNLELYVEYMDTKRIYTNEYFKRLVHTYHLKYDKVQLDAIITTDDNALRFALRHHEEIFQSAPVSFCGINDYPSFSLEGKKDFTGLVEVLDIEDTLNLALKLHPGTRKVFVVVDNTPTGIGQRKEVAIASRQYADLEFEYLKGEDYSTAEILERLGHVPKDSIVLLTVWLRDKNNDYAATDEVGALISAKSKVPVYGIIDMYLGHGIVGGKLLNSETHGRIAAEMAVRIFKGEKPSDIPVLMESSNPYMFDDTQLRRWGIDPSDLPEGSIVINRSFSLYETYRTQIWSVAVAFAFLLLVIAALVTSIMRRKQAEEALRESEAKYRRLSENSPAVVYQFVMTPEGVFTFPFVSDAIGATIGVSAEEVMQNSSRLLSMVHPEDQEMFRESVLKSAESLEPYHEIIRYLKDGEELWVEARSTPRPMADGSILWDGFFVDITERKRAEEERGKLEAQLRQAQKMEAVGQLAGGVAHDFNNLLQGILGYGDLALGDLETDNPASASVKEIMKAANRAATLVGQLLAFSRRQVLEMAHLDLNEVVADLMKMIRRVIGEHIALDVISGHDLGIVRADRGQIEQILMNLCVNARDAMPEGGRITIETENVRIDASFCQTHPWADPGRYALLSLTDTGCGMDKETLGSIFEPFFTTKGVGEGTGLGLSTVYGLVKQHEGLVHVYSEIGKGTTFKIYLPQVERSAATVGDKIEGPAPEGTETVLLAEDDETVRKLSQAILSRAGYTVLTATDGEEALRVFEENSDEIDLALLDVMMPKLGGRAVCDRIRETHPRTRVLFSSGYSMNAIHTNFVLDRGFALIQKPYERKALLRKVREVLDGSQEDGN